MTLIPEVPPALLDVDEAHPLKVGGGCGKSLLLNLVHAESMSA
jgi:hypothetical protein